MTFLTSLITDSQHDEDRGANLLPFSTFMSIDPQTTVGQMITALPSTRVLLQSYGISLPETKDSSLAKALADAHVDMNEFLQAMEEIDWSAESPLQPGGGPKR